MLKLSASIAWRYPADEQDAETLLCHAHQACAWPSSRAEPLPPFDAASDLRARSHHELLQQIRHGPGHGEFELPYQPKLELRTRRLVGAEALIRWNHPQRGQLLPADFMRTAENTEL